MARVTACVLQKGGTAKTTTACALGAGLLRRGHRVLMVDTDPQGNLTYGMGADAGGGGLFEALSGEPLGGLVQRMPRGDIVASSPRLVGADKIFTDIGMEYLLAEALAGVMDCYDYIIVDCPPQLGVLTVNALVASSDIIIPVTSDVYSMQGLSQLFGSIEKIRRRANSGLMIDGILLTRYSGRSVLSRDLKEAIEARAADMGTRVYGTVIREGVAVRESQARRVSIFDYDPGSNQAKDYDNFVREYLGEGSGGNV